VAGMTPIFGAEAAADVAAAREEDELASDMRRSLRRRVAVEVARVWRRSAIPLRIVDLIDAFMLSPGWFLIRVNAGI
jgi:hypothetical protein